MQLLTREICEAMPMLYANDGKGMDAPVIVKFFTPDSNWTWYATEADAFVDKGFGLTQVSLAHVHCNARNELYLMEPDSRRLLVEEVTFFGLVKGHELELGYFSYNELLLARGPFGLGIERDMHFGSKTLGQCKEYEETGQWT